MWLTTSWLWFFEALMVKSELWISLEFKKTLIHSNKGSCMSLIRLFFSLTFFCVCFTLLVVYAWISEGMLDYVFLVWAKCRFILGSYWQRTTGLGTLVSFSGVGTKYKNIILVLIYLLKVKENIFLRKNFNNEFCVKGDWLNIGLSKSCDMILGKGFFF